MIVEFEISQHGFRDAKVVEIKFDGKLMAMITPSEDGVCGIRITSKHILNELEPILLPTPTGISTTEIRIVKRD